MNDGSYNSGGATSSCWMRTSSTIDQINQMTDVKMFVFPVMYYERVKVMNNDWRFDS